MADTDFKFFKATTKKPIKERNILQEDIKRRKSLFISLNPGVRKLTQSMGEGLSAMLGKALEQTNRGSVAEKVNRGSFNTESNEETR